MAKPIHPQLLARLEAIKEIKGEYFVGSWDAFQYLKAMDFYTQLRDEAYRHVATEFRPTARQVAVMVRGASTLAEEVLNFLTVEASVPESLSLATHHEVVEPARPRRIRLTAEWPREDQLSSSTSRRWTLDAAAWLQQNVRHSIERLSAAEPLTIEALMELTSSREQPCLVYQATGERVSMQQFRAEPRFRQATVDEFWLTVWAELEASSFKEELTEEEVRELAALRRHYEARDLVVCHTMLQRAELAGARASLAHFVEQVAERARVGITEEEQEYLLHHGDIFKRAELEQTLGRLETERRVALNTVYEQLLVEGDSPAAVAAVVDAAIARYRDQAQASQRDYQRNYDRGAPSLILENYQWLLRFYRYTHLALRQNRRWLIEFFSR